ncbi:MAG: chemotaxis protein CheB [Planctomycetota bacterium]
MPDAPSEPEPTRADADTPAPPTSEDRGDAPPNPGLSPGSSTGPWPDADSLVNDGGPMADAADLPAIVGIGASAGGLKPLESFFAAMPADSGLAFIVVQHLSPDFKSLMQELLSRQTNMRVEHARDGVRPEPNHVYLIPRRKALELRYGRLQVTDQDLSPHRPPSFLIDRLFRSLARELGPRSIGLVLSGTGSDGTRGVEAIDEAGGLVLVQEPASAEFDGMPRSALSTGVDAQNLPPRGLAELVYRYARATAAEAPDTDDPVADAQRAGLARVLGAMRRSEGIGFDAYKTTSVGRRVRRQMVIAGIDTYDAYLDELQSSPEERARLRDALLISVTSFFRDPDAWEAVRRRVVAPLVRKQRAGEPIRAWVTACADGSEAYSLAILLREAIEASGQPLEAKIFATDVSPTALETAAAGVYPEAIAADVSSERLSKHFTRVAEGYRVDRELRKMVIFARHDLTSDAPLTRMDFVSCRNVLIYMQPKLQEQVLTSLHFALRKDGVLMQGSSETIHALESEFVAEDRRAKLYRKRRDVVLRQPLRSRKAEPRPGSGEAAPAGRAVADRETLATRAFGDALRVRDAACLLIGADGLLLHAFGAAHRYLQFGDGPATFEATRLAPRELAMPLGTAMHRARRDEGPVKYTALRMPESADGPALVDLTVRFCDQERSLPQHFQVTIEPSAGPPLRDAGVAEVIDAGAAEAQHAAELEEELQRTRENLQATIEELESTNEEQQATNEEMLASNEELQSTNEELHSVNEELYTVNAEYQAKIRELSALNSDLDNLMSSTAIGTLFLDRDLRIRRFTPSATQAIHLVERDIGRPLEHLSHRLEGVNLPAAATRVLESGRASELEAACGPRALLVRLHPYLVAPESPPEGVVITLVDVTVQRQTRDALERAQLDLERQKRDLESANQSLRRYAAIVDASGDAIIGKTLDGVITSWNGGAQRVYGYTAAEAVGRHVSLLTGGDRTEIDRILGALRDGQRIDGVETTRQTRDGRLIDVSLTAAPIRDADGRIVAASVVARDVSAQKAEVDRRIRESEQRLATVVETAPNGVLTIDALGRVVFANAAAERMFSREPGGLLDRPASELLALDVLEPQADEADAAITTEGLARDGRRFPASVSIGRFEQGGQHFCTAIVTDLTRYAEARAEAERTERGFRAMADALPVLVAHVDAQGRFLFHNAQHQRWWGLEAAGSLVGQTLAEAYGQATYDRSIAPALDEVFAGRIAQFTMRTELPGVGPRHLQVALAPRRGAGGEVESFYAMAADVTAVIEAEQSVRKVNDELSRKHREMEQFAYTVSHDLKSPLVTITGLLGYLGKELAAGRHERATQLADTVEATAVKMRETIDSLLELGRVGRATGPFEPVPLADAVRAVVEALAAEIEARGASIDVAPDLPVVQGDRRRIEQAIENLLTNALKYGGDAPRVRVVPQAGPEHVGCGVCDAGPGIDARHHQRVFEVFERLTSDGEGAGVGLAIVQRVMDVHGGRAWVESEPGQGAAFWLGFPRSTDPAGAPADG